MASPIGMAIAWAITAVRCPHCGRRQARARDRDVQYYVCSHCHRRFENKDASQRSSPKKGRR